jgi:ribose/xylose/arabinose/galactoside ABC-type transport system permease subunit
MSRPPLPRPLIARLWLLAAANLVLVGLIAATLEPGASVAAVFSSLGRHAGPVVIAGLGMTGILFAGAIDLSVGAVVAVAASVYGVLVAHDAPPFAAHAACAGAAWALTALSGILVRMTGLSPLIVTLAGLALYRGVALIIAEVGIDDFSGNVTVHDESYQRPGAVHANAITCAVVALTLIWARTARTPRLWMALGGSVEACRRQGLDAGRLMSGAFAVSGLFVGVAALLLATRVQAVEPARIALGFELRVIGAVVLGGTSIFGGEGSFAGTVLGAFFLFFLEQSLSYAGVSPYYRDVATGGTIVLLIGVDCLFHRGAKRLEEVR